MSVLSKMSPESVGKPWSGAIFLGGALSIVDQQILQTHQKSKVIPTCTIMYPWSSESKFRHGGFLSHRGTPSSHPFLYYKPSSEPLGYPHELETPKIHDLHPDVAGSHCSHGVSPSHLRLSPIISCVDRSSVSSSHSQQITGGGLCGISLSESLKAPLKPLKCR